MSGLTLDTPNIARSVKPFASCVQLGPGTWQFSWHFPPDDQSFLGHFPGSPVLPGAFLLEMALHAAEFALHGEGNGSRRIPGIPRLRFLHPVLPGDTCSLQVQWESTEQIQIEFHTPRNIVAQGVLSTRCPGALPNLPHKAPPVSTQYGALPHDILPHGHPMVLIDRFVCDDARHDEAIACKNVTINEPCYGHATRGTTTDGLAYPPAMIVESFAQGAGLLLSRRGFFDVQASRPSLALFGEFRDILLLSHARPGDQIQHHIRIASCNHRIVRLTGLASVDSRVIASFGSVMAISLDVADVPRAESTS